MRTRAGLALVFTLCLGPAAAQAPTPALSAEAALRLQSFELRAENISLKIAALQAEFAKLQVEANTFAQTLKRDGYTLERGQDGAWQYTLTPKDPPKP